MSKGQKIALISVLIVAFVVAIFLYPKIKQNKSKNQQEVIKKASYLGAIAREKRCPEVITEATEFLKTNSGAVDIWDLKGSCEFDLGKFEEAKITFEKVLKLDPNNESAKNHLEVLNKGGQIITEYTKSRYETPREEFEAKLKIKIDPSLLTFKDAMSRPTSRGILEYIAANYDFVSTSAEVKDSVKKSLAAAHINFNVYKEGGPERWEIKADQKHIYNVTFWDSSLTIDYVQFE